MTIHEYIRQRFAAFGIDISEAQLLDIWANDDWTVENVLSDVQLAIVQYIPTLLAYPNVSESGFSVSWNEKGLKEYYGFMCKQLGITNVFQPKIRFI